MIKKIYENITNEEKKILFSNLIIALRDPLNLYTRHDDKNTKENIILTYNKSLWNYTINQLITKKEKNITSLEKEVLGLIIESDITKKEIILDFYIERLLTILNIIKEYRLFDKYFLSNGLLDFYTTNFNDLKPLLEEEINNLILKISHTEKEIIKSKYGFDFNKYIKLGDLISIKTLNGLLDWISNSDMTLDNKISTVFDLTLKNEQTLRLNRSL
ncbi:MAG: hypothetical protein E7172_03345 [Firmicutes bacterium]|nr:hypothetical protein [Bacillota bacterium]